MSNSTYVFDNKIQKLIYNQYFYMKELIPKVQAHQKRKDKSSRIVKSKPEDLDYDDFKYIEKYVC